MLVATPVGTGDADEFEGADFFSIFNVRAFAEVGKDFAQIIKSNGVALREFFD